MHETVPVEGLIAIETMTLVPAATPDAGTVTERVVPVLVLAAVPMVLTKAISAKAFDPGNRDRNVKSVRKKARARVVLRSNLGRRLARGQLKSRGFMLCRFWCSDPKHCRCIMLMGLPSERHSPPPLCVLAM